MNLGEYFGLNGDYNGLCYVRSHEDLTPYIPRENVPEEVRDNEYFASKYADIFQRIFRMIERGELKFASREEEDKEWAAACRAYYRYREREDMYYAKKNNCEERIAEQYRAKWCRYPDWYKPSA